SKDEKRLADRIDVALTGQRHLPPLPTLGPFGRRVAADLEDAAMSGARDGWNALLAHCLAATSAKPAARWLKQAKPLFERSARKPRRASVPAGGAALIPV